MNMHNDIPDKQTLSQLMDGEWHDIDPARCVAHACADESLKAAWARWHLVRDALRGEAGPVAADASLALRISAAIEAEPGYTNVTPWPGAPMRAPGDRPAVAAAPASTAAPARTFASGGFGGLRAAGLGMSGVALAASAAFVAVVGLDAWQDGVPPDVAAPNGASVVVENVAAADALAVPLGPVSASGLTSQTPLLPLPVVDLVANTDYPDGSYWVSEGEGVRRGEAEARLNAFLSRHIESAPTPAQQGLLPYSRLVGYDRPAAAGVSEGR